MSRLARRFQRGTLGPRIVKRELGVGLHALLIGRPPVFENGDNAPFIPEDFPRSTVNTG